MAKSKAIAQPQVRHRRKPADAERTTRLLIIGGVIAMVVFAVGLIAFGWYQTQIKPLGKTVLEVGTIKFSLGHLERRMELMNSESSFYQGQNVFLLADDTMEQLKTEALILQGASELNLSITDEEFATEIKDLGGVSEDAEADVYAAAFKTQVDESGLKESEFSQMIKADLLEKDIFDYFKFVVPGSEAQVKADYIVVDTDAKAEEAVTRIRAGEDFTAVGEDIEDAQPGTLDWTPRGGSVFLPEEVESYLFDEAEINAVGDPITVGGGIYVVRVTGREPNRVLDDRGREIAAQRDFRAWVDGLDIVTEERLSEDDENKALTDIF